MMAATNLTYLKAHQVEKIFAIKEGVCYLNDLGFMFLDNGTSTVRMTIQAMAKAFENPKIAAEMVVAHPEFFEWVDERQVIDERYDDGRAL